VCSRGHTSYRFSSEIQVSRRWEFRTIITQHSIAELERGKFGSETKGIRKALIQEFVILVVSSSNRPVIFCK